MEGLYARFENPGVSSVGGEDFEKLVEQHLLEQGMLYLVLFVERKAKTTGIYLNIAGMRGLALNSEAFSFFRKDKESDALVKVDTSTDPDFEYAGDEYYFDR